MLLLLFLNTINCVDYLRCCHSFAKLLRTSAQFSENQGGETCFCHHLDQQPQQRHQQMQIGGNPLEEFTKNRPASDRTASLSRIEASKTSRRNPHSHILGIFPPICVILKVQKSQKHVSGDDKINILSLGDLDCGIQSAIVDEDRIRRDGRRRQLALAGIIDLSNRCRSSQLFSPV